jgi:molybdenum cofactor cytidylyltransferase
MFFFGFKKFVNKQKVHIAIVVLAAGEDTLLKYPKPLLPWGNSTLLGHAIKEVVKTQINDIYVVLGHEYDSVFERHKHFPVHFVKNPNYKDGFFTGLEECMKWISKTDVEAVMFLYGDQPQVDHNYLKEMIHSYHKSNNAIVVTNQQGDFDFPVIFHKNYFSILQQLDNKQERLNYIINQHIENTVILAPELPFFHVNNKDGYDKLHQDWFGEINPI